MLRRTQSQSRLSRMSPGRITVPPPTPVELPRAPLGEIIWNIACAGEPQLFEEQGEYVLQASVPKRAVHDLVAALRRATITSIHYEGGPDVRTYWEAAELGQPNLEIMFRSDEDVIDQFRRARSLGCPK